MKRAAFVTTWWITPATMAAAVTSAAWAAALHVTDLQIGAPGGEKQDLWPALLGLHGPRQRCQAAGSVVFVGVVWCAVFWVSTELFSEWFSKWV